MNQQLNCLDVLYLDDKFEILKSVLLVVLTGTDKSKSVCVHDKGITNYTTGSWI